MEKRNKGLIEPALIYGGIMGGIIVLHSVILQVLNASFSKYAMVMGYLLPVGLMALLLYSYRKEYLGGVMTFQQGFKMGVLISIFYAIITTAYLIILVKFVDPNYLEMVNQMAEEKLLEKGIDEDMIEQTMEFTSKFRSLGFMSVMGFISAIILGVIYSLILAAFLKKEPSDPFASVES